MDVFIFRKGLDIGRIDEVRGDVGRKINIVLDKGGVAASRCAFPGG